MDKKSYYAVIPADVRYAAIPNGAKLLYGEITALCNEKGYCYANNSYFAQLYDVSNRSIGNWLNCLEENGYIKREIKYKDNSKEVDERIITITPMKNFSIPHENNFNTPIEKNFQDNNTDINNKKSIAKAILEKESETSSDERAKEARKKADEARTKLIVNEFNRICTKLPKAMKITPQRVTKVKARLRAYDERDVYKAFEKANQSHFMTGSNGWTANFDWFFENDTNIQKVLEGNYDNKKFEKPQTNNKFNNFDQRQTDFKTLEKKLLGG